MSAAIAAAKAGATVCLLDKSIVGRGGATVMAQMTVAAAIGHEEPDHWTLHLADTLAAGRGLCDQTLSALVCEEAPQRILELEAWGIRWAREGDRIRQVVAPGHSRRRCCYVDFLNTGPAVAATLRRQVASVKAINRVSNVAVTEIVIRDGQAIGGVGLDVVSGEVATFGARAVILAAGGLTKLYARNSASANMAGEAYALALWAGAELVDMEFVQFFPIGHLAPRLVGMDPIMWDPFRYKLGGRLLNGNFEEFIDRYGSKDSGEYTATRDIATYAIMKEVEAGRGSPHGGAYLDFRHFSEKQLHEAFGPVIDRLLANGIDLRKVPVEVGPMAHYHMGGIRVNPRMETRIAGLFAAGEAVGGSNGANRLSGNAISEALVFGERAGRFAAERAGKVTSAWDAEVAAPAMEVVRSALACTGRRGESPARLQSELKELMWEKVGPFRTGQKLREALSRIRSMRDDELPRLSLSSEGAFNLDLQDWFELRAMLAIAETVAAAAVERRESRGAHQREDFPRTDPGLLKNQVVEWRDGRLAFRWAEPIVSPSPGTGA
jgi:succinate dehydrogenase/fumarate reductase flavoprotein subunit